MNPPTQPKPVRQVIPLATQIKEALEKISLMESIDPDASLMEFLESNGFDTLYFQLGRHFGANFLTTKIKDLMKIDLGLIKVKFVNDGSILISLVEAIIAKSLPRIMVDEKLDPKKQTAESVALYIKYYTEINPKEGILGFLLKIYELTKNKFLESLINALLSHRSNDGESFNYLKLIRRLTIYRFLQIYQFEHYAEIQAIPGIGEDGVTILNEILDKVKVEPREA